MRDANHGALKNPLIAGLKVDDGKGGQVAWSTLPAMMAYLEMLSVVMAHPPVTDTGFASYRDASLRNVINSVNSDGLTLDDAYLLEVRGLEVNLTSVNLQNSLMGGTGVTPAKVASAASTQAAPSKDKCTECDDKDRQLQSLRDKLTGQENLVKNKQWLLDRYEAQYGRLNNNSSTPSKSSNADTPGKAKKVTFAARSGGKRKRKP